jgi:hypothetical protein
LGVTKTLSSKSALVGAGPPPPPGPEPPCATPSPTVHWKNTTGPTVSPSFGSVIMGAS